MWQLICWHKYDPAFYGLPFDSSGNGNHADSPIDVETFPDGAAPGSGMVRFLERDSRIRVPATKDWQSLLAIKVECTVRLLDRNLSFPNAPDYRALLHLDGVLHIQMTGAGNVWCNMIDPAGGTYDAINAPNVFPTEQWVVFTYVHNGFDTIALYKDGALLRRAVPSHGAVRGVGPRGVSIGGAHWNNFPLGGDIDEIKIWRLHPQSMWSDFTRRPLDPATVECWERFLGALLKVFAHHPECARKLFAVIHDAFERTMNAIAAKGPQAVAHYVATYDKYQALWRTGEIDGTAMDALVTDWMRWLSAEGLSIENDAEFMAFVQSDCFKLIVEACRHFHCDQPFLDMLGFAMRAKPPGSAA